MREYLEDACDGIDDALFSGDAFHDEDHRQELRDYLNRWEARLNEMEEGESEEDLSA